MSEHDRSLSVKFFLHPKENPRKSKEAGRPIYDEVEMVSIMAPGNQKTEFTARADRMHYDANTRQQWTYAERFADQYRAFKAGIEEQSQGTPLSEAPFLTVGQKAEMRAKNIRTVEQLAHMSDRDIRKNGVGFRAHVDAARAYIDTATGTATLAREITDLRRELEEMRAARPEQDPAGDSFDAMADEDLRNLLTDAGVKVDGRWGREKLLEQLRGMASEAA